MNLPPGSGVQLTPWGFAALGDASGVQVDGEFAAGIAPEPPKQTKLEKLMEQVVPPAGNVLAVRREALAIEAKPLRPADVLKLARRRVKEIRAELKRHAALQKELTQLENMLSAAKHLAPVRDIKGARRAI
jgi:hypothetical protein